MDDRNRRRPRPLANTEIIDEAAQGSDPDVEVFDMGEDLSSSAHRHRTGQAKPKKGKWLDEVKTTVWEGDAVEAVEQHARSGSFHRSVRQSASPARQSASPALQHYDPYDDPYAGGSSSRHSPMLIEAPVRVKVQSVARISPDPRLWLMTAPDSDQAEQFRVVALKLREEHGARVVAVTSPTRKGLGQVAATNVALAFAEGGRSRTVLLDADLRGSEISELFEINQGPGLAEQVRQHRRNPDNNWVTLGLSSTLHFVPAGPVEKNPASVLSSEVMTDLMGEMRRFFDFIVLSTPPVMDSADVNILQEHVDGVVLVVRSGITRRDLVAASINRLGESRFFGAVIVGGK